MKEKKKYKVKVNIWEPVIGVLGALAIFAIVYMPIIKPYMQWNKAEKAWQEHLEHIQVVDTTTTVRSEAVQLEYESKCTPTLKENKGDE